MKNIKIDALKGVSKRKPMHDTLALQWFSFSRNDKFFFLKEFNKDMIWTLGFQCVSALVLITEFHSWIARAVYENQAQEENFSRRFERVISVLRNWENYNLLQFLDVMDSFEETLFWTVFSPYSTKNSPTWKYFTCSYISSPSTCYSQRP